MSVVLSWPSARASAALSAFAALAVRAFNALPRVPASALLLAVAFAQPAPADVEPKPVLSVMTLAGEEIDLGRLRGEVVVLHFWATWCGPCIVEMPELEKFYSRYRSRGVEVIALSQDRTRDMNQVRDMMRQMRMTYPVAMLHSAHHNSLGDQNPLPITYVIDREGAIRARMRPDTQPLTELSLEKIVAPLLPEQP